MAQGESFRARPDWGADLALRGAVYFADCDLPLKRDSSGSMCPSACLSIVQLEGEYGGDTGTAPCLWFVATASLI